MTTSTQIVKQAVEAAIARYGAGKGPTWQAPPVSVTAPTPEGKKRGIVVMLTPYSARWDTGHYALYRATCQVDVIAYQAEQMPEASELAEFFARYWARLGLPDQIVAGDLALHTVRHQSGPFFDRPDKPGVGGRLSADYEFICRHTPQPQDP